MPRAILRLLILLLWPLASLAAPADRGQLFVLQGLHSEFDPAVLAPSWVDGMALQIPWGMIERRAGDYNWRRLDELIAEAERRGKRVTLHLLPLRPPQWLFDAGAEEFRFTMAMRDSPLRGRELREVIPWDPVFLDRWAQLTAELGRRYNRHPAVLAVSITAPAPEMLLPGAIPGTPAFRELERRYRRDVYLAAWKRMIDVYQAAFPDKVKLLVPGIVLFDEHFADDVVDHARQRFGARLWLFNTGLRADGVPQAGMGSGHIAELLAQHARHGTLALQTIWSASDDPQQRMRGPMRDVLARGLALGGRYFEIYAVDVRNPALQDVLGNFRQQLAQAAAAPAMTKNHRESPR